jgi:hypothetical protein
MPVARMSYERCKEAVDAATRALAQGGSIRQGAALINLTENQLQGRLRAARQYYGLTPTAPQAPVIEFVSEPPVKQRVKVPARRTANEAPATRIVAIGDTHQQPGMPVDRWRWIARYIGETRPDKVVHMGDIGEFSSVSRHDAPGSLTQKIRPSFLNDLESVEEAFAAYRKEIGDTNIPHHAVLGNHEERIRIFETGTAELAGTLWSMFLDVTARYDWRLTEYRQYLFINSCGFTHVPMTLMEKPYNGKTLNPIGNELTFSLCFAHSHRFAFLTVPKIGPDNRINILNVGSAMPNGFYPPHNRSEQGATTWGIVDMTVQAGRIVRHEFVPMTVLEDKFGD